ncbi:MAG: 30S ribosomal protein S1 [Deltaproteobacteria bacterium]|nr:30S ribosomal protein S1 [Deltaproteobacteria bacterium]MBW1952611.1 30S ribosomal protein S1 [Deltaproteobacteria bacterium]MBW1986262.1 30S ribosomal protein S1 [Deltaproteobacteria bacterium]MBW2134159.1 30S ribosomal protein S1 [Deltaproteobacteria bacterium]
MDDNNKKPDLINETEPLDTETHAFSEETVTETGAAEEPETGPNGTVQGAAEPEKTGDLERMSELYEESLRRVQEGEVISGRIVSIDKDYAVVDIGYKCEGQIPIQEFISPEGEVEAHIGDQVDVLLERRDDEEGIVMLSKEKASKIKVWEEISTAYQEDGVIEGVISAKVKGGFSVDIGGLTGFLPGSQVDLQPTRNVDALIGRRQQFKVLKYNKKRRNVVLSRRAILEKEKSEQKAQTLASLEEGKVIDGVVKNITDYGIFVDLGGIDGLLHITDMSWGRIGHPSDLYQVGDAITVKVLHFDRENERVSLGLKQLSPDPWTMAAEKYPIGSRVQGKVVSLTDYGAFVELEPGVEGLIHVSEMSWTRKIRHPSKVVNVNDVVEVVVLDLDPEKKRISLGMKQVEPNPWDVIGEKYPVGTVIEGKIKNITEFGIFIGIDEGIDGLVHISDISWTKRIKHPSEIYKKGQEVQAEVLNIDKENERFSLGIKQLTPDPWDTIEQRYPVGQRVNGMVTNVTDFGLFVELEEGIEGLVHISELSRDKNKAAQIKVGDVITVKVVNVSARDRKIGLSIRKLESEEERSVYREYLHSRKEATTPLGEILRESLEESELKKAENKS